jgi:putative Ca2+/H+ antiporter (TMEM165/GDT1 family)
LCKEAIVPAMDALLVSTLTVALAEIGDKTQLLALVLAARYRRPWPIVAGILAATLLNHAASAWVGAWLAGVLSPQVLRWGVVVSFLAVAAWALVPDKLDEQEAASRTSVHGVFVATLVAFFLVEIGDKTQVATVVLAARYHPLWQVVAGTTVGMLLANVPVVLLGARFAHRLPLRAARWAAALLFAVLGAWVALFGL